MRQVFSKHLAPIAAGAALAFLTIGCATKGFVRKNTDPLAERLGEVEDTNSEQQSQIADLERQDEQLGRDVSRVEERAAGAQGRADEAAQAASTAGREADDANQSAQQAHGRIGSLKEWVENLDNYKQLVTRSILFGFDRSDLTEESKAQLDEVAESLVNESHYVVEVRGFTDSSGSAQYNLRLSRARADGVVRYLTGVHRVPLYRVHTIGLGSDAPAADNTTREGRSKNRRVDVTVYAAPTAEVE